MEDKGIVIISIIFFLFLAIIEGIREARRQYSNPNDLESFLRTYHSIGNNPRENEITAV